MNQNGFTESQRKMLLQLQKGAPQGEPEPPARPAQLALVKSHLTRLHDGQNSHDSLDDEYEEWSESCAEFETEELLEVLDSVYQTALRAHAQGRSYNFSAQLAYSLMVWLDGSLADIENEDGDEAAFRPDFQRFLSIFEASNAYFLAMVQHQDALDAEAKGSV